MNREIRSVGIILKKQDPRVSHVMEGIFPWLRSRGISVFLDKESLAQCPMCAAPVEAVVLPAAEMIKHVDAVIVLGGDGTLLHAARLIGANDVPIMGINLGSLGFLTEVKLDEVHNAFDGLLSGRYDLEERVLLDVEVVREGTVVSRYRALNDAVINKGALARIVELEVSINGQPVLFTRSDGLILSTPTGSTAYSLAAGGPILYPTLNAFIIAPICPHTLTNRPLVVPDHDSLQICLHRGQDVMLTVDGQTGMPLQTRDCVGIRRARATLKLLLPFGNNFFKLLREKLRWG
ncbi:MAG TPA: NAD(+)/NADH kinase [Acidobacteriota bacterium]|nr:NAD(+)/NADH kinase [Acidobacteriota bacterium]